MKSNYPVILFPDFYTKIIESKPPIPEPPIEPSISVKPIIPHKPNNIGCLIIVSVFFISGIFYFILRGVGAVNFIWVIGSIFILFMFSRANKEDRLDYEEKLEKYETEIIKYNNDLKHHISRMKEYENLLEIYNHQIRNYTSTEYVRNYRIGLLKASEYKIQKPKDNIVENTKGVSEDYFFKILQKYFGDNVSQNKTLEVNGSKYFPDYTYSNAVKNLYIDIEIDEPYYGIDGTPIHFVGSRDDRRNIIFESSGWFVIRFSEEQIIKQPDECCLIVNFIIKSSMNVSLIDEDEFIRFSNIRMTPKWTKEDAFKLAYQRYRTSYLPKELALNIGFESNDDYSETLPDIDDLPF